MEITDVRNLRLSEDIGLSVAKTGEHCHFALVLIVPESSVEAFVLYSFVYQECLKVKVHLWELEGRRDDAEEDDFFHELEERR